jgi:Ca2+-transporting ATPase
MEPGTMLRPPRKMSTTFLSLRQLSMSIVQGLMITAGCLGTGYYYMQQGADETTIRTVIFITLLFSNIFLTLVNRSFYFSIFKTLAYKNNLVPLIISITLLFMLSFIFVPFVRDLFRLNVLSAAAVVTCIVVALVSTLWIEIWKLFRRYQQK